MHWNNIKDQFRFQYAGKCINLLISTYRYGTRAPTEQCPIAVVIMSLQSIVGVVIQVILQARGYERIFYCISGLHGWDSLC